MKSRVIAATAIAALAMGLGSTGVAAHEGGPGKGRHGAAWGGEKGELRAEMQAKRAAHVKVITDTIGSDADTIKSRMQAGESLGAIAGAKKGALIDALVAFNTQRIDDAVAGGKITAERATAMKSNMTARVTQMVESTKSAR
jgi:hypothetical protein